MSIDLSVYMSLYIYMSTYQEPVEDLDEVRRTFRWSSLHLQLQSSARKLRREASTAGSETAQSVVYFLIVVVIVIGREINVNIGKGIDIQIHRYDI